MSKDSISADDSLPKSPEKNSADAKSHTVFAPSEYQSGSVGRNSGDNKLFGQVSGALIESQSIHFVPSAGDGRFMQAAAARESDSQRAGSRAELVVTPSDNPVANARKLQDAVNSLAAANGGSIDVLPGIYRGHIVVPKGAHDITIQGARQANQRPVFDMAGIKADSGDATGVFQIDSGRRVKIDGFEIRNYRSGDVPSAVLITGASTDVTISNLDIHDLGTANKGSQPILVLGNGTTDKTAIRNLTIKNNSIHDVRLGQNEAIAVNGNVDGFLIEHNTLQHLDNIGIDCIGGERTSRVGAFDRARNGIIRLNQVSDVDSDRNPTYPRGDRSAGGIYIDGASKIRVENNLVEGTNRGIEIGAEHSGVVARNIDVVNNVLRNNQMAAVTLGAGSADCGRVDNIRIEKNGFINNGKGRDGKEGIDRQYNIGTYTDKHNGPNMPQFAGRPGVQPEPAIVPPARKAVLRSQGETAQSSYAQAVPGTHNDVPLKAVQPQIPSDQNQVLPRSIAAPSYAGTAVVRPYDQRSVTKWLEAGLAPIKPETFPLIGSIMGTDAPVGPSMEQAGRLPQARDHYESYGDPDRLPTGGLLPRDNYSSYGDPSAEQPPLRWPDAIQSRPPEAVNPADVRLTSDQIAAATVQRGEGPYQSVERLFGSFSHEEKMAVVHAIKAQYIEDIAKHGLSVHPDMSDLHVGYNLITNENIASILQKLGTSNPELVQRVAAGLGGQGAREQADDGVPQGPGRVPGRRSGYPGDNQGQGPGCVPGDAGPGQGYPPGYPPMYSPGGQRPYPGRNPEETLMPYDPDPNHRHPGYPRAYPGRNPDDMQPYPDTNSHQSPYRPMEPVRSVKFGPHMVPTNIPDPEVFMNTLVAYAKNRARQGQVGTCATGVRQAMTAMGAGFKFGGVGDAVKMGQYLTSTGLFERVPLSQMNGSLAPGMIVVRNWNSHVIAQHGGKNWGDIAVIGPNGLQYNDHVQRFPADGGRYANSYVLMPKDYWSQKNHLYSNMA